MKIIKRTSAIISEYNPFHNGHLYQIDQTKFKNDCYIVAIMSGNFVQRGSFSILDKFTKTEIALRNGVDLVIELPCIWSVSSAARFAKASAYIADSLGVIDYLSFGSESGDIDKLKYASKLAYSTEVLNKTRYYLNKGNSYPLSKQLAIEEFLGESESKIFKTPNNVLAIEYINALNDINSKIIPVTIKRNIPHDSDYSHSNISSASYLRTRLMSNDFSVSKYLPHDSYKILLEQIKLGYAPANPVNVDRAILAKLRSLSLEELSYLPDVSEGLEYRIYKSIKSATSVDGLIENIKTKRYTRSRIRRIILSAFLGITKSMQDKSPTYIRALGFNENGLKILKAAKLKSKLPIVTRVSKVLELEKQALNMFEFENRCTDLFSLALPKVKRCGADMTSKIVRLS